MSKIGITISIDVTKIDKERLYKGEKGTYMNLTTFIDPDTEDQYGNHGFIAQSQTKEERESGAERPAILGNCKVIFKEGGSAASSSNSSAPITEDIPF
jgi:hypothetical protein